MNRLRKLPLLLLLAASVPACGDNVPDSGSPYTGIEPSKTITGNGLSAPVDLIRDENGIPHIYAQTEADAAYANGYVLGADRFLQLDLLRHVAKGRVAEIFGGLDGSQIDSDLVMRMHDFAGRADAQLAALRGSSEDDAKAAALALDRYADGVNAIIGELQAGTRTFGGGQSSFIAPENIEPWTASDSVAIGLLQAWSLSYDDIDLDLTAARDAAATVFAGSADPLYQARARAFDDLFPFAQLDQVSTIDGWPSDGSSARVAPASQTAIAPTMRVPEALLAQARKTSTPINVMGLVFPHPENGSNNWVVGPSLAGGKALLANDPHLQLSNPPMFHAVHITVPGKLDVSGVSLAGIPGVVLGHTAGLAWGATTAYHDVLDFHLETIAACTTGGGNCVTYNGSEVALTERVETFKVGTLGTITDTFTAIYEVVPHHGPILPIIDGTTHRIVPRSAAQGLSVQYTGYQQTNEILALYRLNRAQSVTDGFAALDVFDHGAQNWIMIDRDQHIGWTTSSQMPVRSPGCLTWDPATGLGEAPFFVQPGDGSCSWTGILDDVNVPHAIDPDKGYLVTANADPVGESFDGNPINGPHYAGHDYGPGFREGRITRLLEQLADTTPLSLDDMAVIQGDTHSNSGERLRPAIVAAVAALADELATPGTHPDLAAFAAGLNPAAREQLTALGERLAQWTLATPPAVNSTDASEIADSTATTIFNFWQIEFFDMAFGDELALMGSFPQRGFTIPAAISALEHPETLRTGTLAGNPNSALLCDRLGTVELETCQLMILRALRAASEQATTRFASADLDTWRWGNLHVAQVNSLIPVPALSLPGPGQTYPRPGDTHAVDASNNSVSDYTFAYAHGPSMRNLIEFGENGAITHRWALPGGQIFDPDSPHFRDQMDNYWMKNQYVTVPWLTSEIIGQAEERWVFQPPAP